MKKTILCILLTLFLALAACNPPADVQEDETNAEPEVQDDLEESQEEESVPAEDEQTPPEEELESEPAEQTDNGKSLADFFSMKRSIEYSVAYDFTSTTQGETFAGKMTQYIKGDNMRMDTDSQGVESAVIVMGEETIVCSKQDAWSCFNNEWTQSESDKVQAEVEANPDNYDVTKLPGRTIAGTDTECQSVDVDGSTVEYCFSKEGVPLYVKSMGTGFSSELTATSYETSVSDDAFEPPAEPTSFEENYADLIAQYT